MGHIYIFISYNSIPNQLYTKSLFQEKKSVSECEIKTLVGL